MTNKKTNSTQKSDFNIFYFFLGLAGLVGFIFFPLTAFGLILLALFGAGSTRGDYWKSVGPVRSDNYGNPYIHKKS